jgi:hypothetical protein
MSDFIDRPSGMKITNPNSQIPNINIEISNENKMIELRLVVGPVLRTRFGAFFVYQFWRPLQLMEEVRGLRFGIWSLFGI